MVKHKKYQLLAESTNVRLTKDVNKLLKERWELYGKPFMQDGIFFQAMVLPLANSGKNEKDEVDDKE